MASDSEDERLKEAIDSSFLSNDLFTPGKKSPGDRQVPTKKPSLRQGSEPTDIYNPFNIKVTPQYQEYVSKKLKGMLDGTYKQRKVIVHELASPNVATKVGGIKLLKSSKEFVACVDINEKTGKGKRKVIDDDVTKYEKRAKEAAVSGEWILSGVETKCWSTNQKGEVEVVKMEKGTSVVVDQSSARKTGKRSTQNKNCKR